MRDFMLPYATFRLGAAALTAGLLCAGTAGPESHLDAGPAGIAGPARVVDGDTISVNGTRIRLQGIDAPEAGQTCRRRLPGRWACGTGATAALAALIEDRQVRCEPHGLDRFGRTIGTCFLGGQDVNAWLVRQGHAWAFARYSTRYVAAEAQARSQRLGIWQGEATPAWEYRARRRARAEPQAPAGCAIKGNVTARGRIYHMPWSPWYARVRLDAGRGERWFCTEAEAMAAGWRPVKTR